MTNVTSFHMVCVTLDNATDEYVQARRLFHRYREPQAHPTRVDSSCSVAFLNTRADPHVTTHLLLSAF